MNNTPTNTMQKYNKNSAGFTVVEMVVVVAFVAVFAFILSYLAIFQFTIYNTQTANLTIAADARTATDEVDTYVRQAHRIATSYSTYSTGTQALVLQIPSIDGSGQAISATYDTVVFYLTGTDFYRQLFPDAASSRVASTKKLAANIDTANFSFTYNNASLSLATQVTTNIAIKQAVGAQTKSISFSSQATLRNY